VIQVSSGSVAQRAGIRVGDVIVTFNGTPLAPGTRLRELTAGLRWGDEVRVGLRRDGALLDLPVPIRRAP
jgi:serine protease Do